MRRRRPRLTVPRAVSIYDPLHLGIDEDGRPVTVRSIYRNLLTAGEPGTGKSGALNNVVAHAVLADDCRLWLVDGRRVELGLWRSRTDLFARQQ